MAAKRFTYEILANGCCVIAVLDISDQRRELFYLSTVEETIEVVHRLNAAIEELMGEE